MLVHFRLEHVTVGWIKLGGKSIAVRGPASARLPAGTYRASKKHAPGEPWDKCGSLRLTEGKEWKVFVGPTRCRAEAFGT